MGAATTYDVLLVDDDADLAASTTEYLAAFGLAAAHVADAAAARAFLRDHEARVILLDVNLPGRSGFDLCRELRRERDTPIVFVSARRSDDDEILALSLGGDDYLRKPYSLGVLLAKVRRILDRQAARDAQDVRAGPAGYDDGHLRWDPAADRFWVAGAELVLPAMEHRLLRYAVEHRGRVLTKRDLFANVWGEAITGEGTLTVHVARLRRRIEPDPEHPTYLRTVHGRGYLFEGPTP